MEAGLRAFSSGISSCSKAFKGNLERPVREHLTYVFGTLTAASVMAAVGAYLDMYTTILSAGILSSLGTFGFLMALLFTPPDNKNIKIRIGYLSGFALCTGVNLGPLIAYSVALNPQIVVTALVASIFIFASFTLSALVCKRGSYLFLAAPLSTLLTTLIGLSFANIFFGSTLLWQAQLYLGLALMCAFVLFDTSLIIEKRRMGDTDFISHGMTLFLDLIGIFKRILIILTQKEENERRRRRD